MTIQRYSLISCGLDGCHASMQPRSDGCYVPSPDYAALEARCAGLERERDQNKIDINELVLERDELQHTFELHYKADMRGIAAWQESTGKTLEWPDKGRLVEWMLAERDALQAKLAETTSELESIRAMYGARCERHCAVRAKLAAAEEVLRMITDAAKKASMTIYIFADGIVNNSGDASACEAAGTIMDEVKTLDAILAGHAPTPKGEGDE